MVSQSIGIYLISIMCKIEANWKDYYIYWVFDQVGEQNAN